MTIIMYNPGMIFFQLFNWFQLEVAGHGQIRSKEKLLKVGVVGFSYFQLFSFLTRIIADNLTKLTKQKGIDSKISLLKNIF
jgi:hypothetical protein